LIDVLDAEVVALRDGRFEDADALRRARQSALDGTGTTVTTSSNAGRGAGHEDLQGAAAFADVADPAEDGEAASDQSERAADGAGHVDRDGSAVGERAASGR
jgi:hypothetical protein